MRRMAMAVLVLAAATSSEAVGVSVGHHVTLPNEVKLYDVKGAAWTCEIAMALQAFAYKLCMDSVNKEKNPAEALRLLKTADCTTRASDVPECSLANPKATVLSAGTEVVVLKVHDLIAGNDHPYAVAEVRVLDGKLRGTVGFIALAWTNEELFRGKK